MVMHAPQSHPGLTLDELRDCCEEILGHIEWDGEHGSLEECPGHHLHTTPFNTGHCNIHLDQVPTVFCFHQSCKALVEEKTREVRKALIDLHREAGEKAPWLTGKRRSASDLRAAQKARDFLAEEARRSLPEIIANCPWNPREAYEESAPRLLKGRAWQQHLSLFNPFDLVWIGDLYNSGPGHGHHFRLAQDWMDQTERPFGCFICPSTFKRRLRRGRVIEKAVSRSNRMVDERRLLVLESDVLANAESCAVYRWCRDFMTLRALVLSGNKSIHAYFDFPKKEAFDALKIVLPALGMDVKLINGPSQPCRFAGAWRKNGGRQHLIWFDQSNPTWRGLAPFLFEAETA